MSQFRRNVSLPHPPHEYSNCLCSIVGESGLESPRQSRVCVRHTGTGTPRSSGLEVEAPPSSVDDTRQDPAAPVSQYSGNGFESRVRTSITRHLHTRSHLRSLEDAMRRVRFRRQILERHSVELEESSETTETMTTPSHPADDWFVIYTNDIVFDDDSPCESRKRMSLVPIVGDFDLFSVASSLNGNQGSWTNTDDLAARAGSYSCTDAMCTIKTHWHRITAPRKEAAERRLAEKKPGAQEKRIAQCMLHLGECSERHLHFPTDSDVKSCLCPSCMRTSVTEQVRVQRDKRKPPPEDDSVSVQSDICYVRMDRPVSNVVRLQHGINPTQYPGIFTNDSWHDIQHSFEDAREDSSDSNSNVTPETGDLIENVVVQETVRVEETVVVANEASLVRDLGIMAPDVVAPPLVPIVAPIVVVPPLIPQELVASIAPSPNRFSKSSVMVYTNKVVASKNIFSWFLDGLKSELVTHDPRLSEKKYEREELAKYWFLRFSNSRTDYVNILDSLYKSSYKTEVFDYVVDRVVGHFAGSMKNFTVSTVDIVPLVYNWFANDSQGAVFCKDISILNVVILLDSIRFAVNILAYQRSITETIGFDRPSN